MSNGEISNWLETDKINRVRHANGQRHTNGYQSSAPYKKSKKFQGQPQAQGLTQAKVTKTMPCVFYKDGSYSHQKHHETRGVYYKHICSTCFAQEGRSSAHSAVECRHKNSKRIGLGMAFGNKGPAQDKLATSSSSYAYGSRIINCRNKGTVSQYGAPSHVWKQWLSMSNMCKPVDPRRSFAEILKTCPSKYGNTSKSKVTTLSKVQVHQVPNKATPSGQGKSPCVHKTVYKGHTVNPVPCYNRFDPMKQFDTQELDQNENSIEGQTGHKVKSKVKLTKHSNVQTQNVHKLVQQDITS